MIHETLDLQMCLDLLKFVPGLSSETGATFSDGGGGINSVKVEEVTDVQEEEEVPMPISCSLIKGEHEVSYAYVGILGTFHKYLELLVDIQISIYVSAFELTEL
jgi:hypothetical protein